MKYSTIRSIYRYKSLADYYMMPYCGLFGIPFYYNHHFDWKPKVHEMRLKKKGHQVYISLILIFWINIFIFFFNILPIF